MNPQDAIDFSREAINACMMIGGPILIVSLIIGLLVGIFQAMTQVQDQTVSFVPKILLLIVTISLCLPWLTDQMTDFAKTAFSTPMTQWSRSGPSSAFPSKVAPEGDSVIIHANTAAVQESHSNQQRNSDKNTRSGKLSPFQLPSYRFSEVPKTDIDG